MIKKDLNCQGYYDNNELFLEHLKTHKDGSFICLLNCLEKPLAALRRQFNGIIKEEFEDILSDSISDFIAKLFTTNSDHILNCCSYVSGTVKNQCLTFIKKDRRMLKTSINEIDFWATPVDDLSSNVKVNKLKKALSQLSSDDRYIIEGLYFEKQTTAVLAEELKMLPRSINNKKNRILNKLKNLLS